MARIETVTFNGDENGAQVENAAENFTSINGIYGAAIAPQFSNAKDNVHQSPLELLRVEEAYSEQRQLRFFSIR